MISKAEIRIFAIILASLMLLMIYTVSIKKDAAADAKIDAIKQTLEERLAAIQKDKEAVKTPAQIAAAIPKYTPDVHPVLLVAGGPQAHSETVNGEIPQITLADAPSAISEGSLLIPKEQVPAYWDSVTKCAESKVNLEACQGELKAEKSKHGGFLRAVGGCAVKIGLGAGVGGAFGGQKGAIGGGAAGAGTCLIKF